MRDAANYGAREAGRGTSWTSSRRRCRPCSTRSTAGQEPKGLTLRTAGAGRRGRDVLLAAGARPADRPEHDRPDALARCRRPARRALEPRLVLPGTVGAISLLVGLYGLQVLPVSVAGGLLLLLAFGLFVDGDARHLHGALTLAGAVTFVIGALMLFDPAGPAYQVSVWTAVAIAATLVLLLGVALSRVVRARRNPVEVGVAGSSASRPRCGATGSCPSTVSSGEPAGPAAANCRRGEQVTVEAVGGRPRARRRIRQPIGRDVAPWTSH